MRITCSNAVLRMAIYTHHGIALLQYHILVIRVTVFMFPFSCCLRIVDVFPESVAVVAVVPLHIFLLRSFSLAGSSWMLNVYRFDFRAGTLPRSK